MKKLNPGDFIWLAVLIIITLLIILPPTHAGFIALTTRFPYPMGFLKFALLASMGELLVVRLKSKKWLFPQGFIWKVLVWGLLGVAITFMFTFFSLGVAGLAARGMPGSSSGWGSRLLQAFLTSALMNLTFGPVFMALHRITDTAIEFLARKEPIGHGKILRSIDWPDFISFVVLRTIPIWWIPVHTITFLLPVEYRVLVAAYLSIVLGIILVYARNRKPVTASKEKLPER